MLAMKNCCIRAAAACLALALFAPVAWGQDVVAMGAVAESPVVDDAAVALNTFAEAGKVDTSQVAQKSASEIVEELFEAYMRDNGLENGYNAKADKYFYFAKSPVEQSVVSPDFGKSRVLAFEKAYLGAQKQFVKDLDQQVTSEIVQHLFADNSSDAGSFEQELGQGSSTLEALASKALALGDAMLSSKLEEYGIDPQRYSAAPPDQKKTLLEDAFLKRTVTRASKALAGVTPIQTFIGQSASGSQTVGVLLMYSPKLEAIASCLAREQKPQIAKQGPPLRDIVPLDDKAKLYDLLGVRVLFDENGPVVVSYGQWSSSYTGENESMRERHRGIALDQADSLAAAQLAAFLNSSFSTQDEATISETVSQSKILRGGSGDVEEVTASQIVDVRNETSKSRTSARLKGASTLKRWVYKTPEGHEIVGVIKTYSFAGIQAAKRGAQKPGGAQKKAGGSTGEASGRKSVDQMNINDF